jgi:MraZ protein
MFTSDAWSLFLDKLQELPLANKSARDFLRLMTYNATPVEMDKLGRTHLPDSLVTLAGIKKDIVFAGALSRVEVWAKDRYHSYVESLSGQEGEIEEALKELGI